MYIMYVFDVLVHIALHSNNRLHYIACTFATTYKQGIVHVSSFSFAHEVNFAYSLASVLAADASTYGVAERLPTCRQHHTPAMKIG